MSTAPTKPAAPSSNEREENEIKIVSHSNLFYWWPLWAVGFILGVSTYFSGTFLAFVPKDTKAFRKVTVSGNGIESPIVDRDVLVVPEKAHLHPAGADLPPTQPYMRISENKSFGVFFTVVLLLLIVITNVPLRGLWSLLVLTCIVLVTVVFAWLDVWDPILETFARLHIHINAAGYLLISLPLFIIWLVTFLFFDQQIYMIFTPGQLRVRQEIGGGEIAYDTAGMSIQKQRNDLFRHWCLGLGSGDLIVTTSGATSHHFDLPNVLFVGHKVRLIEDMLREKAVVSGGK
jgi:hypothetical protein